MNVRAWTLVCAVSVQLVLVGCGGDDDDDADAGDRDAQARPDGSTADGGVDCGFCIEVECRSEMQACNGDTTCAAILQCGDSCQENDWACIDHCVSVTTDGSTNKSFQALFGCVSTKCKADCGL